jgi:hypothetical protein
VVTQDIQYSRQEEYIDQFEVFPLLRRPLISIRTTRISLTKKKIWAMAEFSRTHLQEGHTALMWKDTTCNYAYFLWFEDSPASPLKPTIFPTATLKNFPRPGILCGDFLPETG